MMIDSKILSDFQHIVPVELNVPLKTMTTIRVGGPAAMVARPQTAEDMAAVLRLAQKHALPCLLVGNGSNMLVADSGFDGLAVHFGAKATDVSVEGTSLRALAGALLSVMAAQAAAHGLSGMEALAGIPGTAGGAALMNAGAYGHEISEVLASLTVLTPSGEVREVSVRDMDYGYRHSRAMEEGWVILAVTLQLAKGEKDKILAATKAYNDARKEKQPLQYPSAGSFFKRPTGHFAGALIEQAGLKGLTVGGARVSEKHAGFLINAGDATAADFVHLARQVRRTVYQKYGVALEPEVRFINLPCL